MTGPKAERFEEYLFISFIATLASSERNTAFSIDLIKHFLGLEAQRNNLSQF